MESKFIDHSFSKLDLEFSCSYFSGTNQSPKEVK